MTDHIDRTLNRERPPWPSGGWPTHKHRARNRRRTRARNRRLRARTDPTEDR